MLLNCEAEKYENSYNKRQELQKSQESEGRIRHSISLQAQN